MTEVKKIELSEENLELVSGGVNFKKILNKIYSKLCSKKSTILLISATVSATAALTAGTIAGINYLLNKKRSNNNPINILLDDSAFKNFFAN